MLSAVVKAVAATMLATCIAGCGFKLSSNRGASPLALTICLSTQTPTTVPTAYSAKPVKVNVHKLSYALASHNIKHRIAEHSAACPNTNQAQAQLVVYPLLAHETSFSGPIREITLSHSLYYQLLTANGVANPVQSVQSEVRFQGPFNASSETDNLYRIALTTLDSDLYNKTATHLSRVLYSPSTVTAP